MKKIVVFCMITLSAFLITACGAGDIQRPDTQNNNVVNEESKPEIHISQDDYESNINGIKKYFEDSEYVYNDPVKMSAQFIGAKEGYRYQFKYEKSMITVELYEFDIDNLNDTANRVINSINSNGYFMMDKTEVNAIMSNNGKYMIIYRDDSKNNENQNRKNEIIENFKTFK